MHARPLTRRELLKLGLGAGAGIMAGGCGLMPVAAPGSFGSPTTTPATVAAARGRDLAALTRQALDTLGGLSTIVQPGETVFIKPNLLTAGLRRADHVLTGEITKPDIVSAVAEECLRAGARQVIIGDGAQVERFDWEELKTVDGSTHLAAEAARLSAGYDGRVTLACLNSDSPEWVPLAARRSGLGEIHVSSLVARADRIITIPVVKTHRHVGLSLSLKNFMGVTPIARYGGGSEEIGRFLIHYAPGGPPACVLDIVDALRPDLAIIDASIGCEGYGPWVRPGEGRTVDLRQRLGDWVVLASTDPVAADATAARMVGHDPRTIDYLWRAYEDGLGQARADRITLDGATLDELRVEWEPIPS